MHQHQPDRVSHVTYISPPISRVWSASLITSRPRQKMVWGEGDGTHTRTHSQQQERPRERESDAVEEKKHTNKMNWHCNLQQRYIFVFLQVHQASASDTDTNTSNKLYVVVFGSQAIRHTTTVELQYRVHAYHLPPAGTLNVCYACIFTRGANNQWLLKQICTQTHMHRERENTKQHPAILKTFLYLFRL